MKLNNHDWIKGMIGLCYWIITLFNLISCAAVTRDTLPPDTSIQGCNILRQEIIQNDYVANTPDGNGRSPTKDAQLYKAYAKQNCSELMEANKENPLPVDYKS